MSETRHVHATPIAGRAFFERRLEGPIDMLNLLRFTEVADYAAAPDLAPESPISGREAYARYEKHTLPFLTAAGGEVRYLGTGGPALIGPDDEVWDKVILVRYPDAQTFLTFSSNPDFLAGTGHRTAALLDSRLIPLQQAQDFGG